MLFVGPGGNEQFAINAMIEVQAPSSGFTEVSVPVAINLDGLTFPEAGAYAFEIRVDGNDAERLAFGVDLTTGTEAPQGLTSSRPPTDAGYL
jgi:hypothetical protein